MTERFVMDDLCYLGSLIRANRKCNKEVKICNGEANAVFGKPKEI